MISTTLTNKQKNPFFSVNTGQTRSQKFTCWYQNIEDASKVKRKSPEMHYEEAIISTLSAKQPALLSMYFSKPAVYLNQPFQKLTTDLRVWLQSVKTQTRREKCHCRRTCSVSNILYWHCRTGSVWPDKLTNQENGDAVSVNQGADEMRVQWNGLNEYLWIGWG